LNVIIRMSTREQQFVEITHELTLRGRVFAWCQECGRGSQLAVTSFIARYGIDARVADLVPKLNCRQWRTPTNVQIERLIEIYRRCSNEPYYEWGDAEREISGRRSGCRSRGGRVDRLLGRASCFSVAPAAA
jgi:hypothetical protein